MPDSTPDLFCSTFTAEARQSPLARESKGAHFMAVLCSSLALHGLLLFALDQGRAPAVSRPAPVKVTVLSPAPRKLAEPSPEAPTASATTERTAPAVASSQAVRKARKRTRDALPAPVVSKPPAPDAAPSEPLDFTGVTLTAPGQAGWASVTGNGQAGSGPLGAPPRGDRAGLGHGAFGTGLGSAAGPRVAALGSLSRPPQAPALDQALLENYPKSAREQGISGRAVVRARILPDGSVGKTQVLTASSAEFGRACQRTVQGSRWSAPLDDHGQPVATDLSYTCQFEVIH